MGACCLQIPGLAAAPQPAAAGTCGALALSHEHAAGVSHPDPRTDRENHGTSPAMTPALENTAVWDDEEWEDADLEAVHMDGEVEEEEEFEGYHDTYHLSIEDHAGMWPSPKMIELLATASNTGS